MNDISKKAVLSLEMLINLKRAGILNPVTARMLVDAHTSADSKNKYEILQNAILFSKILTSPFDKPDASANGPMQFAFSENNQAIGIYPEDCHVLFAGQTGTGKSILMKLISSVRLS